MTTTSAILENDMAAARAEARGQYGVHANAEELIRAHAASISPEVRSALRKPLNEEATKTLDRDKIAVPEGGKLVDAVVRGNSISFVWEDERGYWYKGATGYDSSYEGAEDDPATQIVYEQTKQQAEERAQTLDWHAEMEQKIGELRRELEAEHAKSLAKLREEHAGEIESLRKRQDEAVAERSSGSASTRKSATRKTGASRKTGSTRKGGRSRAKTQMDRQQNDRKVSEG